MKRIAVYCCLLLGLAFLPSACATRYKQVEVEMYRPINCATAEGDIRMLEHEKAHVANQIAMGVTSIAPAGFVLGVMTETEGTKIRVATGEYNKMIDRRIREIRETCLSRREIEPRRVEPEF